MKIKLLSSLFAISFLSSLCYGVSSGPGRANSPPRGWNSYDSFCWTISEAEFLQNAALVSQRLRAHGYEYVVVDYLWYRRKVPGAYVDSLGFDVIDQWGRVIPDPDRWPSSEGGRGFTEVANKVHKMGLKFGIHVMRGISRQAYDANALILDTTTGKPYVEAGRQWRAQDIGVKERACAWMKNGFMSVNTKLGAGRAFLRSLYEQYASWGVDFVKNDCVFGDDLDIDEITFVSEVLQKLERPILYSLSPGTSASPTMAKEVNGLVNMYRITGDDWDNWRDVAAHFNVARDFSNANMIGANGLLGNSWPDLDMLPLGWLTDPGSNEGPHRACNLNLHEQRTQMTLWAMAKSPLMFGGDVRKLDQTTFDLITNPTVLEINSFSSNNKEFPHISSRKISTSKERGTRRLSTRCHKKSCGSQKHILSLTSCKDPNANGWSVEALEQDLEQICWKKDLGSFEPWCLYKRRSILAADELIIHEPRKHHLFASDGMEFCLDASPRQKLVSSESRNRSFSPCRRDSNQMWELNNNGALVSNYSGLCATVISPDVEASPGGTRSWIATGSREGVIYVAFFNLNEEKTVISARIADIAEVIPGRKLRGASCKCKEIWNGRDFGVIIDSISMEVEVRGSALFVLYCS